MTLTVGSLFSGIGGLDLGLERAGMNVIWQSEIDPYACRVLKKHWPEVPNYGDIKQIDWSRVERPAVVCGGYPCQPFSTAGNRKGEEDSRHLWPWVREAISELRPDYAILENVRGHLSLGGTTVIADLAAIGYDAEWRIVSAASVGANHRRDRIIIVAYPYSSGMERQRAKQQTTGLGRAGQKMADTDDRRCQQREAKAEPISGSSGSRERNHVADTHNAGNRTPERATDGNWSTAEQERKIFSQSWIGRHSADDIARNWQTEPDVGRVANGVPNRVDRLRGLGNAVVPQVAEIIGRLVVEHATHN
jgi:DNA (cytosine-5)-methyltransferase 1